MVVVGMSSIDLLRVVRFLLIISTGIISLSVICHLPSPQPPISYASMTHCPMVIPSTTRPVVVRPRPTYQCQVVSPASFIEDDWVGRIGCMNQRERWSVSLLIDN